eukprot:scaffold73378_cov63-Phaeocystis_antarctica.AAC.10
MHLPHLVLHLIVHLVHLVRVERRLLLPPTGGVEHVVDRAEEGQVLLGLEAGQLAAQVLEQRHLLRGCMVAVAGEWRQHEAPTQGEGEGEPLPQGGELQPQCACVRDEVTRAGRGGGGHGGGLREQCACGRQADAQEEELRARHSTLGTGGAVCIPGRRVRQRRLQRGQPSEAVGGGVVLRGERP